MTTTTDELSTQPRSPAPLRALLSVVGAILAIGLVLFGAFMLLDQLSGHTFTSRASYRGIRSLIVEADSGDIKLTSAPRGAQLAVVEQVTQGLRRPRRHATLVAGALRLSDNCPGFIGTQCGVTYQIAVPVGVAVLAHSGAGDVSASHLVTASSLELSSGAGDIKATAVSASRLKLDSGAGDVAVSLANAPQLVDASSGAGDLQLKVPNVGYAIHASSGAGTVSDGQMRNDPASSRRIDASSGAGDVTIVPAG